MLGCDGRGSSTRTHAGLALTRLPQDYDVLWDKAPAPNRLADRCEFLICVRADAHPAVGYVSWDGRLQYAVVMPKGGLRELAAGDWLVEAVRAAPAFLAAHLLAYRDQIQGPIRLTALVGRCDERVRRPLFTVGTDPAPQFVGGTTLTGPVAEHEFGALVTVRRGDRTTSVLFDAGLFPDALVTNADRLQVDLTAVQGIVLSHGHFDHAGGLAGLGRRLGRSRMPIVVHPMAWTRRRLAPPGAEPTQLPTLDPRALAAEGFTPRRARKQPSLLVNGCVLITGEVDRVTDFELGMPPAHQVWTGEAWQHDPLVI